MTEICSSPSSAALTAGRRLARSAGPDCWSPCARLPPPKELYKIRWTHAPECEAGTGQKCLNARHLILSPIKDNYQNEFLVDLPKEGVLKLLRQGNKVKGAVGLRQRHLPVPLQLHGRVRHDGG